VNSNLLPFPANKPTGVDWFGGVPAQGEVVQLGRIGRFSKGSGGNQFAATCPRP